MDLKIADCRLPACCSILVQGPSGSGKSSFVFDLIRNRHIVFRTKIKEVIYFYTQMQETFKKIAKSDPNVHFVRTVEEVEKLHSGERPQILIFDDIMNEVEKDKPLLQFIMSFFLARSHHENTVVVLQLQNLFPRHPMFRNISINAKYIVLMKSVREQSSIVKLGYQIMPNNSKFLSSAFAIATKLPYTYLLCDFHPLTPDNFRFRNFIHTKGSDLRIFLPEENKCSKKNQQNACYSS